MRKYGIKLTALMITAVSMLICLSACASNNNKPITEVKYSEPLYYAEDNTFGYYIYEDHAELKKFFGAETLEVSIPSEINDTQSGTKKPLTVIGKAAFSANTGAQTLNIPDSVIEIRAGAFHDCTGIEHINFGKNIKKIGTGAFSGCMSINEIILPDSLETISDYAFSGCSTAETLDLANVKEIGDNAFEKCISINEISGGDNLQLAGQDIFSDTSWYKSQTDEFVTIGKALIKYNGTSSEIRLDKKIEGISNVFSGNKNITKIDMSSVKFICNNAFSGCTTLKTVKISDDTEFIGCDAFADTPYIDSLQPDENGFVTIGKVLVGYTGKATSLRIPDGLTMISNAFKENKNLTDISTGDSVKTIGMDAFYGCNSLKTAVIGKNVNYIDEYAFYGTTITEFNAGCNSYAAYWATEYGLKNIIYSDN